MAAISAEQLKKQQNESKSGMHLFSAFMFIFFGVVLILKLLNINYFPLQYLPEQVLYWIVAVGSTFGGIYMIYKGYLWRRRVILK